MTETVTAEPANACPPPDDVRARYAGASIKTYTGRYFFPLDPHPEDVDVLDIAHALSNQCRFSGHVREFYSVAQHSVLVSQVVELLLGAPQYALRALLHDAAEAYLVDLPRPLKREPGFGERYKEAEAKLLMAICAALKVPAEEPAEVHLADNILLVTEARDLMDQTDAWYDYEPLDVPVLPVPPEGAKAMFLGAYARLGGLR